MIHRFNRTAPIPPEAGSDAALRSPHPHKSDRDPLSGIGNPDNNSIVLLRRKASEQPAAPIECAAQTERQLQALSAIRERQTDLVLCDADDTLLHHTRSHFRHPAKPPLEWYPEGTEPFRPVPEQTEKRHFRR